MWANTKNADWGCWRSEFSLFLEPDRFRGDADASSACEADGVRKDSLESESHGGFNLSLNRRVRDMESGGVFIGETVYFYQKSGGNKADCKRGGPGIIIGVFGRKFDLVYCRRNAIDVDLNDLAHADRTFDVIVCDGELHMHLADRESHIRYLWGSETLASRRKYEMRFHIQIKRRGRMRILGCILMCS